jgi:hypothetical protein
VNPYEHYKDCARRLLVPLAQLMEPGRADLPIAGPASDHDAQADRLESFARPMLLAAFWLQAVDRDETGKGDPLREQLATWFRAGLVSGSDPRSPHYWGPDANYHQHHVEMGLMAISLQFAREALWDPLPAEQRAQIADWFATSRGGGIVNNNHLFMSVHILEFLRVAGFEHRTDSAVIETHLNQLETMHRGGGWFEDGINQAFDHYNAYAFHFYGLCWARLHGARDPARAERWRGWARSFVEDYQHFFAASGEHPAFGRSIMYRFNTVNVFGLAAAEGCCDIPPGRARRICIRNVDHFLARPITQEQGCLAFGWTDRFEDLAEPYSCAASPYWAAKGFAALLVPPTHAFWTSPDAPLPAERGDFVRRIPTAGLLVRGVRGEVEILNSGSMVGNTQLRYGAWKWSKLAYRTGTAFTLAHGAPATNWSTDLALVARHADGREFGRHSTVCVEMDDEHVAYACNLGFKTGQANTGVETFVWWRSGWLLTVHHVQAREPVELRLGGFSLDADTAKHLHAATPPTDELVARRADGKGSCLQPLAGFDRLEWDARLDDSKPRRHLQSPFHLTPVACTPVVTGRRFLAALMWTGYDEAEGAPWSVVSSVSEEWILNHPALGRWTLRHWSLPPLASSAHATP